MNDKPTILAVDDTSESLALLVKILTSAGYQVSPADSGELALAAVAANPPDLILLDVRMEGVDGLEVCRRLKAHEETRHIPIILISAFADVKEWVEGLQLGAADYITKPFQIEELLMRVKTQISLKQATISLEQQAAALRQTNEQLQSEIINRLRAEDKLSQNLDRAVHSRQAMLSALEDQKRVEKKLQNNYFAQSTINMILNESLIEMPLEGILQKVLNMILAVPWIVFEPIGSIFLVEDDADVLVMKAQSNLHESITKLCVRVPFGKCYCGKTAQSQKIEFSDHIDDHHEICFEGMQPHGHYAVPILFGRRTIGVLTVYLKEGHIRDKNDEEFLSTVADTLAGIIMRKKAEERIEYLAYYDVLTGLPNRNLFLDRINQEIARAKNSPSSLAVVITDINKFKSIYDIYGSEVGDRVLKEVAERLSTAIGKGDIAAHLGNDEFGIALMNIRGDDIILLEKIIKTASYPLKVDGEEISLTFSTGISLYPHDGENAPELLKAAGLALSIAKKEGRNSSQFYMKDMNTTASELMALEKQLMQAIKNEEFILHYQPYWDITTKKMVGMEALIRWQSKDRGLVPPGKFIPVLEDTGMIIEVGEWILREAMRQVKEWQNNGYPVVPVSVNMSLVQFRQKDLAEMIKRIMTDCGFYPSLLTLEITESAFMQDIEFTRSVLTTMKGLGCSVSIDDFGTGYSSMAYLKRFPIDNLKIDISFIREMLKDPDSASIVVAIINMAHTLNLKTIAEGIETEEQWNFLRLVRSDMGQGFYLSKPLPAGEFEKILKGNSE